MMTEKSILKYSDDVNDFSARPLLRDKPKLPTRGPLGMDLKSVPDAILNRRATLHFKPEKIPQEYLTAILECGAQAPSGYNLQPWRFILVEDASNKKQLAVAAYGQRKIIEAAVVIIAVGITNSWKNFIDEIFSEGANRGAGDQNRVETSKRAAVNFLSRMKMDVWVTRHTMIAVSYMMLAAESFGFDTAPMEGFNPVEVKRIFNIPEEDEVVALLGIGKADEPLKAYPGRLPLACTVFKEKFGLE